MLKEYLLRFSIFTIVLVLVASIIGLVRYRRLPASLQYLTLLACFDVLMEAASYIIGITLGIRNLFLMPFVAIGELTLLGLAYREALQSLNYRRVLPWVLSLFSAYALFISFSQLSVIRYAIGLEIIVDLLTVGMAGLYFQKLLNELHTEQLRYDPFFWVSVGLAVHGLADLLISLSSNYLLTHYSVQLQLLIMLGVRNLFNALLYVSYCVALWLRPQKDSADLADASITPRA